MNPTKEDYEDGEAWLDKTAITPDEYSREAVAYAHGRASMRAEVDRIRAERDEARFMLAGVVMALESEGNDG